MKGYGDVIMGRFDLDGKVAVVTGGTGILGSLYCRSLAEAGASVIIADLDPVRCDQLAAEINGSVRGAAVGAAVDLGSEISVKAWAAGILRDKEKIDIVINNAATKSPSFFAPLGEFPLEDWNHVMGVNITGMFLVVRELGPVMVARGVGSIINVSSIYGVVGPDQRIYEGSWYEELGGAINTPLVYSVSKGAVIAMTRYLAAYWGPHGIRTNTLTPGGVSSGQNSVFSEKYSARIPLGRMAQAEDMVGALLFLASDASSYVNGQNIIVDGGLTAW
jgi:NAD(P)-dependent dehydrogenase (short-subunit alcohol dehydrogenase family)